MEKSGNKVEGAAKQPSANAGGREKTDSVQAAEALKSTQDPSVRLKTDNLKSSYCNVCNTTSTREEVVLNFGINANWDRGGQVMDVELMHRIIMSPFAAKRLNDVLTKLISEHESRFSPLS